MSLREEVVRTLTEGGGADRSVGPALVLAPMATITHAGFRSLVHEFGGCDLYFTEMLSAEALCAGTSFESYYLDLEPAPSKTIYQLIGYSSEAITTAAQTLLKHPCAGLDLNMGCSAPHIVRKGGGIAWMSRESECMRLVESLRAMTGDRSLSAKLRLGPSDDPEKLAGFAGRLQDAGVDFVTLHPKKQRDGSARPARWEYVDLLERVLDIPVVGNGGVENWASYKQRAFAGERQRGAIMVGRGAVRAPWLFNHLRCREAGKPSPQIDLLDVIERFFTHLEASQPQQFWPSRARRLYPYFLKNLRFAHSVGARLGDVRDYEDGKNGMLEYLGGDPSRRFFSESG